MGGSGCPFLRLKAFAADRCPFLKNLTGAETGAQRDAVHCPVLSSETNFAKAYEMFHGEKGVVPRDRRAIAQGVVASLEGVTVGLGGDHQAEDLGRSQTSSPYQKVEGPCGDLAFHGAMMAAPIGMASISLSSNFAGTPANDGDSEALAKLKAAGVVPHNGEGGVRETSHQQLRQPPPSKSSGFSDTAPVVESRCPLSRIPILRDALGDLLLPTQSAGKSFKLACPSAIVKMRAAFAATPAMRALRPHELGVRLAAVATTSLVTNVPLGAWREHLVKFSPEWFVAVHASIPLIIMMRKSLLLPQLTIIATIGCAILGQFAGSRLERKRVRASKLKRSLPPPPGCGGASKSVVNSGLPSCPLRKLDATKGLVESAEETFATCPMKLNSPLPVCKVGSVRA
mmetsp:Transcript_22261/g.48922  ORF Transcript_22261/g.48922 Transcript_22261/m.48922 type:complete len:399 (-) Transcript_22261:125-1321(-)|eukprot:CAMPEP_0118935080 /NCGR_PEP_ID=MMETSP1169-20130426/14879_1 /TAXON_ID=36882 /ORGANISM="Pyramimonas obovata, Strain CCMP722" /LENGTH=398 /DNA_ID=CAMNT_0006878065 /DNA_START=132 /DNA_END=1328 /DNA_ORIENTATION=+